MTQKSNFYEEELLKINNSLDWIEDKIELAFEEIEDLESQYPEVDDEGISAAYKNLDFLLIQLASEKEHLEKIHQQYIESGCPE